MATITKSVDVALAPGPVWDAVRDWGHVHQRLCPGVLTDCQVEEGARTVTFANGLVARELIVTVDDGTRRLVWSVVGSALLTHHNGAMQVLAQGQGGRIVWTADILPHDAAERVAGFMDLGCAAMKTTLEG
ncbi:SRPBCC family protein [Caulobacter sp. UNC279MFTsu5.1]|uniref:SRPBCC family protein n=1 Tax=Caulobacter sp. UNC279MFTsu5.1 TaxID=1502775 RepID=UPI0008E9A8EC|nr:SRPBCC family protein [Caulobacter sp. UNC279MFTsu5.1]SFK44063.1 Polyketide cyclase / dehydrase and lipid transport [Caulobacter sp. UNC279MFTsu5.1]